jgi:hypothetical protein
MQGEQYLIINGAVAVHLVDYKLGVTEERDSGCLQSICRLETRNEGCVFGLIIGSVLTQILADFDDRLRGLGGGVDCYPQASTALTLTSCSTVEVDCYRRSLLQGELREGRGGREESNKAVLGE